MIKIIKYCVSTLLVLTTVLVSAERVSAALSSRIKSQLPLPSSLLLLFCALYREALEIKANRDACNTRAHAQIDEKWMRILLTHDAQKRRRREEGSGSWDFILELRTAETRSAETSTVVSTSRVETQYLIIFIVIDVSFFTVSPTIYFLRYSLTFSGKFNKISFN